VTAAETPPAVAQAGPDPVTAAPEPERRCPRCATPLRPEQEWCLNCGAGVGATVAEPRGWRWPLAAVAGILALAAIAFALALVELAGNAEKVDQPGATPTPAAGQPVTPPAATPQPSATPTADPNAIPPASGGTTAPPEVADWPAGKTGYTVVLESSATRSAAEARATELAGQGIPVGVLDSSGYAELTPNRFVVFSGQYETRADARSALQGLTGRVEGAKVARVAPA
jgi:septal ring-binding cell division protein DamX